MPPLCLRRSSVRDWASSAVAAASYWRSHDAALMAIASNAWPFSSCASDVAAALPRMGSSVSFRSGAMADLSPIRPRAVTAAYAWCQLRSFAPRPLSTVEQRRDDQRTLEIGQRLQGCPLDDLVRRVEQGGDELVHARPGRVAEDRQRPAQAGLRAFEFRYERIDPCILAHDLDLRRQHRTLCAQHPLVEIGQVCLQPQRADRGRKSSVVRGSSLP